MPKSHILAIRQTALLGLVLAGWGAAYGQSGSISVTVQPLWQGPLNSGFPVEPIRVTVENQGGDDVATISIEGGGDNYSSRIDLPAHGVKSVDFYLPSGNGYDTRQLTVVAKHGLYQENLTPAYNNGDTSNFGFIGDETGAMTFLRKGSKPGMPWSDIQMSDWYCKPDEAPDRAVGYWGMDTIVMGDGAERLSDDGVKAIQRYVLSGGNVVFLGGASKPVLNDKRWAGYLPVAVGTTSEARLPDDLSVYGQNAPGTLAVTGAKPLAGASVWGDKSAPALVWRHVGLGSVGFLPVDPFAGDMRRYGGLKGMFFAINKRMTTNKRGEMIYKFEGYDYDPSGYSHYNEQQPTNNSVFQVKLPSVWSVGGIMLAYVVLVVPINFLVLRRLRRGEMAWVTAPLLAAGFAGVFFTFSGQLYQAGSSKQTSATIVAAGNTAIAVGSQQLFLPRGGTYDLKWQGIEAATASDNRQDDYSYDSSDKTDQGLAMVEADALEVPALQANNLSFYSYRFAQGLDWTYSNPGVLSVKRGETSDTLSGTLTNTTDHVWQGVTVAVAGTDYPVDSRYFNPGDTIKVSLPFKHKRNKPVDLGQLQLKTTFAGIDLGSHVGKETTPNDTVLMWSLEFKEAGE